MTHAAWPGALLDTHGQARHHGQAGSQACICVRICICVRVCACARVCGRASRRARRCRRLATRAARREASGCAVMSAAVLGSASLLWLSLPPDPWTDDSGADGRGGGARACDGLGAGGGEDDGVKGGGGGGMATGGVGGQPVGMRRQMLHPHQSPTPREWRGRRRQWRVGKRLLRRRQ